ncbi:MAG: prepilin-type N-terminal cleavage/methylation domain-containing protein [Erysipelotrichia bacterium]|nr:prepilin-type N-terminal cleavage/methylation domain-containing protein [Erysipelotrichia bacterium]
MTKKNKKGFTLAELLVVVAIIAVLVAVSIPIFTAQLEKARLATNQANARAAKAEAVAYVLGSSDAEKGTNTVLNVTYTVGTGEATYAWAKADKADTGTLVGGTAADTNIPNWTTTTKVGADESLGKKQYSTIVVNVNSSGTVTSYYAS